MFRQSKRILKRKLMRSAGGRGSDGLTSRAHRGPSSARWNFLSIFQFCFFCRRGESDSGYIEKKKKNGLLFKRRTVLNTIYVPNERAFAPLAQSSGRGLIRRQSSTYRNSARTYDRARSYLIKASYVQYKNSSRGQTRNIRPVPPRGPVAPRVHSVIYVKLTSILPRITIFHVRRKKKKITLKKT